MERHNRRITRPSNRSPPPLPSINYNAANVRSAPTRYSILDSATNLTPLIENVPEPVYVFDAPYYDILVDDAVSGVRIHNLGILPPTAEIHAITLVQVAAEGLPANTRFFEIALFNESPHGGMHHDAVTKNVIANTRVGNGAVVINPDTSSVDLFHDYNNPPILAGSRYAIGGLTSLSLSITDSAGAPLTFTRLTFTLRVHTRSFN